MTVQYSSGGVMISESYQYQQIIQSIFQIGGPKVYEMLVYLLPYTIAYLS